MPATFSPSCAAKQQPEQQRRPERERRAARSPRRPPRPRRRRRTSSRAKQKRPVKAADRARRRHGHADDEQRHDQERPDERTSQVERHATRPRCPRRSTARAEATAPAPRAAGCGRRTAPQPGRELLGDRAPRRPTSCDGSTRSRRSSISRRRAGLPGEHEQHARAPPSDADGGRRAAHFTGPNAAGLVAAELAAEHEHVGRQQHQHREHVEHALEDDRRERARWRSSARGARGSTGRMTSPARAGSRLLAANPTAVARNALPKPACPSGSSRYCQRHARSARLANIVATREQRASPARARRISRPTPRRSTFCRNRPTSSAASASTMIVLTVRSHG